MSESEQGRLAGKIVDFLQRSMRDGSVPEDQRESVEVAAQCVADAFGVPNTMADSQEQSLLQIFKVYEATRSKMTGNTAKAAPTAAQKQEAERHKTEGNQAMSRKEYDSAIESYSRALDLVPDDVIYLSNRAAAYSQAARYDMAVADARKATDINPGYGKAWSRLGHALFASGDVSAARDAYARGCEVDPASEIMKRGLETTSKRLQETGTSPTSPPAETRSSSGETENTAAGTGGMPDLSSLMGMLGGGGSGGGAGGAGGIPDFSALLNNPGIMNMMNSLQSSGAMDRIMSNPRIQESMRSGRMPNMADLMSDPDLTNQVRSAFGGNNQQP